MYSIFGVLLSWGRGKDDEFNTLTAGTATGFLYKSSGEIHTRYCFTLQLIIYISPLSSLLSGQEKVREVDSKTA